jgi:hypothetical protein
MAARDHSAFRWNRPAPLGSAVASGMCVVCTLILAAVVPGPSSSVPAGTPDARSVAAALSPSLDERLGPQPAAQNASSGSAPLYWSELPAPLHPSNRTKFSMVYDWFDHYVLLFGGGTTAGNVGDTWIFQHDAWTNVTAAVGIAPRPRHCAAMAYDPALQAVILFGGSAHRPPYLSDTWAYRGGVWVNVSSPAAPSARACAGAVYDASDGYLLLFGGHGSSGLGAPIVTYNDTWSYTATAWNTPGTWTQLHPGPSPPARSQPALAYDDGDHYVLLFGGYRGPPFTTFNDTWDFAGGHWTNLTPTLRVAPSPRTGAATANNSTGGYVILFGGRSGRLSADPQFSDTWEFLHGQWISLPYASNPLPRNSASLAWVPGSPAVFYLFGGRTHGTTCSCDLADTWILTSSLPTYALAFGESGLPSGVAWSVTLGDYARTSLTGSISFQEPNGTYLYRANSTAQYLAQPYSGTLVVNGSGLSVKVSWLGPPASGSPRSILGIPAHLFFIATGVAVVVAAVALVAVVLLRRRRKA